MMKHKRSKIVFLIFFFLYEVGCTTTGSTKLDTSKKKEENTTTTEETYTEETTDTTQENEPDNVMDSAEDTNTSAPEPPVNLLENESFENGETHWNIWGGAYRVESNAQDGSWALHATDGNGAEQLVEGLEPNTTYRLSGWGKTEGSTGMTIGVKFHGNKETRIAFTETEYTEKSLSFTTGFGNTSAIIYAYKPNGEAAGYADNLFLSYESESPYTLIWADEFNGSGPPDENKWIFEEGFVRNQELQWYQEENAFQEGGMLVIEGRQEQKENPNYIPGSTDWRSNREYIEYTSSSIKTKGKFEWQYGRIVIRAKVTNLTGTWPAIWMLGINCQWPSNGEVDIMENYGGNILANFAWGTNQQWTAQWDSSYWAVSSFGPGWTDQFHLWELEWNENSMTIYLDGIELNAVSLTDTINGTANCSGQNPFQQPHYILLNLALGGTVGGSVDDLVFPTPYLVDYLRVYQTSN